MEKGYAEIKETWDSQRIEIRFEMPAHFVFANPNVRADAGKAAIVKGPLVYCMEEMDNGENLSNLFLDIRQPLKEYFREDLLGGVTVIVAKGKRMKAQEWKGDALYADEPVGMEEKEITFVPYCNWGNRIPGEMAVWVKTIL